MICATVLTVVLGFAPESREMMLENLVRRHMGRPVKTQTMDELIRGAQRSVTKHNVKGLSCKVFWTQDAHLHRAKYAPKWALVPRDLFKHGVQYKTCLPCHASPVAALQLIDQLPDLRRLKFRHWQRSGKPL